MGVKTERRRILEVADKIKAMSEVRYLALTTGPWDLLVEAFVGSRHHMAEFLLDSVGELEGVTDTETFSVLRIAKFGYEWEVPEYDDGRAMAGESNAHPVDRVGRGASGGDE